jgi:hypothetical protein
LHSAHFHRCVPAAVSPFFFIRPPHPGHRFACLGLVLISTRVTREDHIFYLTKKEQDETLTPTRPNPDVKHHFLAYNPNYIVPHSQVARQGDQQECQGAGRVTLPVTAPHHRPGTTGLTAARLMPWLPFPVFQAC